MATVSLFALGVVAVEDRHPVGVDAVGELTLRVEEALGHRPCRRERFVVAPGRVGIGHRPFTGRALVRPRGFPAAHAPAVGIHSVGIEQRVRPGAANGQQTAVLREGLDVRGTVGVWQRGDAQGMPRWAASLGFAERGDAAQRIGTGKPARPATS